MMNKSALAVISGLLIGFWSGLAFAEDRLIFDPVKDNDLSKVVIRIEGAKTVSQPVTDVHLDIVRWEGKAREVLIAPNKPGRDPWDRGFQVALHVVSGGKLYRNGGGECSAWEKDISVCTVECDGGHFLLQRTLGEKFHRLTVILRPLPELFDDGDETADIRIGECGGGEDEPIAVMLDVKSGNEARLSFSRWAE